MRFLHKIGKSTLTQGITVPVDCQSNWMLEIPKGERVEVSIFFDQDEVNVDLRRIDNVAGHLQFRYERKQHKRLRGYLKQLVEHANQAHEIVVEVIEIKPRKFQLIPFSGVENKKPRLTIHKPIFHLLNNHSANSSVEFSEIKKVISSINFVACYSQKEYNRHISDALQRKDWSAEEKVLDEIGLRCDFFKNGVWVEVEFGNARSYYQDYIKFLIAAKFREYKFGVLLCPTVSFASYLCDLGRQRAEHRNPRAKRFSYSGMMTYEKAVRELPFLNHIIKEQLVIAGLDVHNIGEF